MTDGVRLWRVTMNVQNLSMEQAKLLLMAGLWSEGRDGRGNHVFSMHDVAAPTSGDAMVAMGDKIRAVLGVEEAGISAARATLSSE